jgi:hypothetical protein
VPVSRLGRALVALSFVSAAGCSTLPDIPPIPSHRLPRRCAWKARATTSTCAELRSEKCFLAWFAAIERYPRQLREVALADYLVTKRAQRARQRASP